MLSLDNLAHYLVERGLVGTGSVVEGDLILQETSSRNSSFSVVSERGPSYIVKQGIGPDRSASIANEAAIYRLLHSAGRATGIEEYVPEVHVFSGEEPVLVLGFVGQAQSLDEYHSSGLFPLDVAFTVGEALGRLHRLYPTLGQSETASLPVRLAPWALHLHRPTMELYHQVSGANLQLIKTIQRFPEFVRSLEALRGEWRATTLVHYDMKWENILVGPQEQNPSTGQSAPRLQIVDWELAGRGDPLWDIGSVLGEYLKFWMQSIPFTGSKPPHSLLDLARYPLSTMQPAMLRFWQSYSQSMEFERPEARESLERSVRYAAARLVQALLEQNQGSVQLPASAYGFLQLSFNMLQRPLDAAADLLGVPQVLA